MVIHCPACKSRMVLANSGAILQEWECSHCHNRFRFADGRFISCGSWIISEKSGELRAVCPYCSQHYAAEEPEQPRPVQCVHCGETFLLSPNSYSERSSRAFRFLPRCDWVVSEKSGELRAVCPYCRQHYAAPDNEPSKQVKCVYCGETFLVAPRRPEFPFDLPAVQARSGRVKRLQKLLSNLRGRRLVLVGAAVGGALLVVVLAAVLILRTTGKDRAVLPPVPEVREGDALSDDGK